MALRTAVPALSSLLALVHAVLEALAGRSSSLRLPAALDGLAGRPNGRHGLRDGRELRRGSLHLGGVVVVENLAQVDVGLLQLGAECLELMTNDVLNFTVIVFVLFSFDALVLVVVELVVLGLVDNVGGAVAVPGALPAAMARALGARPRRLTDVALGRVNVREHAHEEAANALEGVMIVW